MTEVGRNKVYREERVAIIDSGRELWRVYYGINKARLEVRKVKQKETR